jgi:hypothetical protein
MLLWLNVHKPQLPNLAGFPRTPGKLENHIFQKYTNNNMRRESYKLRQ